MTERPVTPRGWDLSLRRELAPQPAERPHRRPLEAACSACEAGVRHSRCDFEDLAVEHDNERSQP